MKSNKINILITGSGAPGTRGTVYSLREINYLNKVIGVDVIKNYSSVSLVDKFYKVPKPSSKLYANKILYICKQNNIHLIVPQTTNESSFFAIQKKFFEKHKIKVLVSSLRSYNIANDKYLTNKLFKSIGFNVPKVFEVNKKSEIIKYLDILNFPNNKVVIKAKNLFGKRGFLILDNKKFSIKGFLNNKVVDNIINYETFKNIFPDTFPSMMLMEFLPGREFSVDMFIGKKTFISIPRLRTTVRSGVSYSTKLVHNNEIMSQSLKFAKQIKYRGILGLQFKEDNNNNPLILECNPRVQGTMIASTIAGANLLKMQIDEFFLYQFNHAYKINWNSAFDRYLGGYGYNGKKIIEV